MVNTNPIYLKTFLIEFFFSKEEKVQLKFKNWKSEKRTGFNLYHFIDNEKEIIYISPLIKEEYFPTFSKLNSLNFSKLSLLFDDAFLLILHDKEIDTVHISNDRLGTFPIYYSKIKNKIFLSPLVSLLSRATGKPLEISREGFINYLTFGYCIPSFPFLYCGIERMNPSEELIIDKVGSVSTTSYWNPNFDSKEQSLEQIQILSSFLKKTMDIPFKRIIGTTAGKDSLALIAAGNFDKKNDSFATFGQKGSSDAIQGNLIAERLNFKINNIDLVEKSQIKHAAEEIAFYSSGMATLSYVDMFSFIQELPQNTTFIMGEGGECVREFFKDGESDFINSLDNYITPPNLIDQIIEEGYFDNTTLLKELLLNFNRIENKGTTFYRFYRMPGNFSLRNSFIFPTINKISPFLHNTFMDQTFYLDQKYYSNSGIHRAIIENGNPDLLIFFDQPIKSNISTQNWEERIKELDLWSFFKLYKDNVSETLSMIHFNNIRKMIEYDRKFFSRAFYLYMRILSLTIFLSEYKKINNSLFPLKDNNLSD